jgi:MYXO-CTERM domain-containing protein
LPDVDADSTVSPTVATGGIVAAVLLIALAVAAGTRRTRRTTSA